ncbi:MAG: universal stress protein [Pseudomonadota bacterium]
MKILLATDGSETARTAVDFLLGFPFPAGSEVIVLTVIKRVLKDAEMVELSQEKRRAYDETRQAAEEEAGQLLAAEAQRLRDAGWAGSTELRFGHPATEIIRSAEEKAVDIVVVGSHGLSGMKRFLLGSVSNHVLEAAHCSVLIVRPPTIAGTAAEASELPVRRAWRLMLAFDDSPPARKAVELCASLPLDESTEVKAITVLPLVKMFRQDIRQQLSWVWQDKKKAAKHGLEWVEKEVRWATSRVSTQLIESPSVSHAILDAGVEQGADLLILGHKGKKAMERFLMGSTAAQVAHHACCSVLAVRD